MRPNPSEPVGTNLRVTARNRRFRINAITRMPANRSPCPSAKSVHLNTFGDIISTGNYSIRGLSQSGMLPNVLEDSMQTARRSFFSGLCVLSLGARYLLAQPSQRRPVNGMPPFPNPSDASGNGRNEPPFSQPNPKWQLKENQK